MSKHIKQHVIFATIFTKERVLRMKRIIAICLVVFAVCFSFSACSKPNEDKDDDKSTVSDINEGVGDAVLDVNDIFGNNSASSGGTDVSGSSASSENGQSESGSSNGVSKDGSTSEDGDSSENSSENANNNSTSGSSKIDYEDPDVWTKPVGGQ